MYHRTDLPIATDASDQPALTSAAGDGNVAGGPLRPGDYQRAIARANYLRSKMIRNTLSALWHAIAAPRA